MDLSLLLNITSVSNVNMESFTSSDELVISALLELPERKPVQTKTLPKRGIRKKTRHLTSVYELGVCERCHGKYVEKHMERHMRSCDGTQKHCRHKTKEYVPPKRRRVR